MAPACGQKSVPQIPASSHLAILQTQVRKASHWGRLALGELLVHGVNAVSDVIVSLGEQFISVISVSLECLSSHQVYLPPPLNVVKLVSSCFGTLTSFFCFSLCLRKLGLYIIQSINYDSVDVHKIVTLLAFLWLSDSVPSVLSHR